MVGSQQDVGIPPYALTVRHGFTGDVLATVQSHAELIGAAFMRAVAAKVGVKREQFELFHPEKNKPLEPHHSLSDCGLNNGDSLLFVQHSLPAVYDIVCYCDCCYKYRCLMWRHIPHQGKPPCAFCSECVERYDALCEA